MNRRKAADFVQVMIKNSVQQIARDRTVQALASLPHTLPDVATAANVRNDGLRRSKPIRE